MKNKYIAAAAAVLLITALAAISVGMGKKEENPASVPAVTTAEASSDNGKIVINEIMEKNRSVAQDAFGEFPDWIELKNISEDAVSLAGWTLSDGDKPAWEIPDVELGAGELLLIFASGKDLKEDELHTDFAIKGEETIALKDPSGGLSDSVECRDCEADIALARDENGMIAQTKYATPGYENTAEGYELLQQTMNCAGALQINEVMVSNNAVYADPEYGYQDWVEIKNISDSEVLLSDYYLSDSHKDYYKWRLPERSLEPGAIMLIFCDGRNDRSDSLPGTNFSLNSENEQLFLSKGEDIVDRVYLRDIPYEGSYGRMDGENGWFFFTVPTPGTANAGGERSIAESPEAVRKGGIYDGVDSVTVELSAAGTVRYTLDGSLPNGSSAVYTEPIVLKKTTVVRAISYVDGKLPSRAMTETYIINEGHSLPVLSLATDSPAGFEGMYWGMQKGVDETASLSLYELDGGGFTIGCDVSMNGETSLVLPKKNMSVRFRGAYGSETLKYDIYGGGVTEFTNLLLRAGQDFDRTIVRNELCQELCARASDNVINQRSIWCVLYINGEYSGIYTLKEKANEQLYASVANVSRDSVELIEAGAPYNSDLNLEVLRFCIFNDMSLKENYDYICNKVDIDSLIDWTIMEAFCANVDLTDGNLRYVRSSESDNKWRLMFYDLDSTFTTVGGGFANLMSDFAYNNRQVACLTYRLIENEEYKDRFLRRAAELFETVLTNEAVIEELNRQCDIIAAEVPRDIGRFNRTVDDWMWSREELIRFINGSEYGVNWRQYLIDELSEIFDLTEEERQAYFGEIDGK